MRSTRILALRFLLCAAPLMCSTVVALAQGGKTDEYPKFEFFGGYSALGEINSPGLSFGGGGKTPGDYTSSAGFAASIIGNFNKHFGIRGDFSAHFDSESGRFPVTFCNPTCITATQDNRLKTRVYNYLAGPEWKARNKTRLTPFVYALAGAAHTRADFTSSGPTLNLHLEQPYTSFAMALGGGLDIRATKRFSIRGSLDYNPVFVNDPLTGTRDFVRFSLGLLFH